jgi:DNA (cytosine-5)-methyltransferase 1
MAFETLKHNLINEASYFEWIDWLPRTEHDVTNILRNHWTDLKKLNGSVDLVAGGPPCQGFSQAGRRNRSDERNRLVNAYARFIHAVKPRMLFFENVKGFTFKGESSNSEPYSNRVSKCLERLGYKVKSSILDFSEYGLPQRRRRYILVGMLSGDPEEFFREIESAKIRFLRSKGLQAKTTLKEAISDLQRKHGEVPSTRYRSFMEGVYGKAESNYQRLMRQETDRELPDSHRFTNHRKRTTERLKYILKHCPRNHEIGDDIKSKFQIQKKTIIPLEGDALCPTLTTLPDDYIHYQEPRTLTVREYARIQSFPDWFEFKSNYTTGGTRRKEEVPRYTQVGNAIPPLFMELSGQVLEAITRA